MQRDPNHIEGIFPTVIEGKTFDICTEALYREASEELSGEWHAWCFFAYDREINIYPPDSVPVGVSTQESIAGETRTSQDAAVAAVEESLKRVIKSRSLDGTGFYSPPADKVYPQEFPDLQP